ncbi:MAG: hypothetical protein E7559_02605, partial [Ruminococcaceae bacterium]|nr:hypothetical protein [Oscillospiraceae bacterium]
MITRHTIILTTDSPKRIYPDWAYRLYAQLCREAGDPLAELLHVQGETPLSQYLQPLGAGRAAWQVTLLSDEAAQLAELPLSAPDFRIEDEAVTLTAESHSVEYIADESELLAAAAQSDKTLTRLMLRSPCTFKRDGQYVLFPSVDLIVSSLVRKWNGCSQKFCIDDEDAVAALVRGISIENYRLQSNMFHMKGAGVRGFS